MLSGPTDDQAEISQITWPCRIQAGRDETIGVGWQNNNQEVKESGRRQPNAHETSTTANAQVTSGEEANAVVLFASWAVRGDGSGNFLRVDNLWDANTSGRTK